MDSFLEIEPFLSISVLYLRVKEFSIFRKEYINYSNFVYNGKKNNCTIAKIENCLSFHYIQDEFLSSKDRNNQIINFCYFIHFIIKVPNVKIQLIEKMSEFNSTHHRMSK